MLRVAFDRSCPESDIPRADFPLRRRGAPAMKLSPHPATPRRSQFRQSPRALSGRWPVRHDAIPQVHRSSGWNSVPSTSAPCPEASRQPKRQSPVVDTMRDFINTWR